MFGKAREIKEIGRKLPWVRVYQENVADLERSKDEAMTEEDSQTARRVVDSDPTPSDLDLVMLRDFCHSHKLKQL